MGIFLLRSFGRPKLLDFHLSRRTLCVPMLEANYVNNNAGIMKYSKLWILKKKTLICENTSYILGSW